MKNKLTSLTLCLMISLAAQAEDSQATGGARIVSKYKSVWTAPPSKTPSNVSVDGPLLGNGDMKVAIGGPANAQSFYIGKNDLWLLKSKYGVLRTHVFGRLTLAAPALKGASYKVSQSVADGVTEGTFGTKAGTLRMKNFVAATRNLLVVELSSETAAFDFNAGLTVTGGDVAKTYSDNQDGVCFASKEYTAKVADIASGYAAAWKVFGGKPSPATATPKSASLHLQIGREQYGKGRWGFHGAVDDLHIYDRVLSKKEKAAWAEGKGAASARHSWSADTLPPKSTGVTLTQGKVGKAWQFSGGANSFIDCGVIKVPVGPVTVGGWIRIDSIDKEANYILSTGEWSKGLSFGLSDGKLRFLINGKWVDTGVLPTGKWLHVVASFDGAQMTLDVDGKEVARTGDVLTLQRFTVKPGQPVTLLVAIDSVFKSPSYKKDVVKVISGFGDTPDLSAVKREHAAWWANYWPKGYLEIDQPLVEAAYYRSLYTMAAVSRDPKFPPGIFGWDTTDKSAWGGAYWMNYNHVAPYHALVSCNRLEQHDPQDTPMLQFMDQGRHFAKVVTHTRGLLYPVGLGPMGIDANRGGYYNKGESSEGGTIFHQQRSNAAYGAVNMIQRWYGTYDPAYGKKVYPYIREVATFWEDYLKFENGRYIIYRDAIHEGSGWNTNPILSLGFVHNTMAAAIDMSTELGVDAGRRRKWQHIIDHLSGYTTQKINGKTVFRYTEKGTNWWRGGTLGLQQIYPANTIGLDSNPKLLQIARNTAMVMQRWHDGNGSTSMFPVAVRIGLDPNLILTKLVDYAKRCNPNGFQRGNVHGIENCSTIPNTLNEMLCMSHLSVGKAHLQAHPETRKKQIEGLPYLLRLFPVWPKNKNARFVNIRSWGAFLVSAELKDGAISGVKIVSERGRDCHVLNPWPGASVRVVRNGEKSESVEGERFTFKTKPGEIITLETE